MSSETHLVRLKPYDPRRGCVVRRYTYRGIKFQDTHGWYRVDRKVADYLRSVRQVPTDEHSPLAFDVCLPDEALAIDARENEAANPRKAATDEIQVSTARPEEPKAGSAPETEKRSRGRGK